METSPHSRNSTNKFSYGANVAERDSDEIMDDLALDFADMLKDHKKFLASKKCLWLLRFHTAELEGMVLPHLRRDPHQANFLRAWLTAMTNDAILLRQGVRSWPGRLIEAYRTRGGWTAKEEEDAEIVSNLIWRLEQYGVIGRNRAARRLNDKEYSKRRKRWMREFVGEKAASKSHF
jgi:hypothetical protein